MNRLILALGLSAALSFSAALVAARPAAAQNIDQIASVKAGKACPNCNLFQADLAYHDLPGALLSGARLRQADLSLSTMNGADLSDADLSVINAFGARFSGVNLAKANLSQANLTGAYLGYANLRGTVLNGAVLNGANLIHARGLTQGQLDTACGDSFTRLPAGMHVPRCR